MKKLLFLLATAFAFTACDLEDLDDVKLKDASAEQIAFNSHKPELWYVNESGYKWKLNTHLICDNATNIVYLFITEHPHQAGITPYYNAKGEIMRCDELK